MLHRIYNIAVLVITYEGGSYLQKCIQALQEQTVPATSIAVIFTGQANEDVPAGIKVLQATVNSYAFAVNLGISAHPKHDIIILNDDTVPTPTFIAELTAAAQEPGIYQPQIRLASTPEHIENAGHWLFHDGFNFARGRGRPEDPRLPLNPLVFSGAAAYLHHKVIADVGAFDEDIGSFGEDVDWSLRALRQGYPVYYIPQAIIYHHLGASYGRGGQQKAYWVERNRIQAAIRSLPRRNVLLLPVYSSRRLILQGLGALQGRGVAAFGGWRTILGAMSGHIAGYALLPKALHKRKNDAVHWRLQDSEFKALLRQQNPPLRDIWHPTIPKSVK